MKPIDGNLKQQLESGQYKQLLLLHINIAEVDLFFSSWGLPIEYQGVIYTPRGFSIDRVLYSEANIVDNVTIAIDDVDRLLMGLLAETEIEKFPVILYYGVLTETYKVLGTIPLFAGDIARWEYSPPSVKIKVASIFSQWAQPTSSQFSGSCRWKIFKGLECQYAGSSLECDRTYTTCEDYGNTRNFGGFRWLPSMVNKKIEI